MKTDFVVLWVDGSDPEWLKEKMRYDNRSGAVNESAARFRDWGNLQYWFRAVEKFAPWVNRVFFITWGHLPAFLNIRHPKLRIVKHTDYIPEKYLPTFNSNTIELNLHRISDLSETFVLFNDDTFLLREVSDRDFFIDGLPCDEFIQNAIVPLSNIPIISHTSVNNISVINKYFKKNQVIRQHRTKIFNLKYGKENVRNILLESWGGFTGFYNPHIPLSHLKSTFETVWEKEPELMDQTCRNRFRMYTDLNHWLMRYWNLCSGRFVPRKDGFGKLYTVSDDNHELIGCIRNQKRSAICINDTSVEFDFQRAKKQVIGAFETILHEKSSFEI